MLRSKLAMGIAALLSRSRRRSNAIGVRPFILCAVTAATGLFTTIPARADAYRLVADDKIVVRVIEWRSGEGEYKDWKALGGAFVINDSGSISVPLVGEIAAAGLTTKDLAATVADALQMRAGLQNRPFVSIEVLQYGPIYLAGDVATPGQYPFTPGLTTMKAVSLAGGLYREPENIRMRLQRERIEAVGKLNDAELEYNGLLMRQARLKAEMEGKDSFDVPGLLINVPGIDEIRSEELRLMKFRKIEFESRKASARDLGNLHAREIETLENKIREQQRQLGLLEEELGKVNELVRKGLSVSARRFELDRDASDAESKLLDLEFQLMRSRQSLEENKRDSSGLVNARNSSIQNELNTIVREIAKADLQVRISQLMVDDARREGQTALDERPDDIRLITFRIVRKNADGVSEKITALSDTPIEPRDLIEVEITEPGGMPGPYPSNVQAKSHGSAATD